MDIISFIIGVLCIALGGFLFYTFFIKDDVAGKIAEKFEGEGKKHKTSKSTKKKKHKKAEKVKEKSEIKKTEPEKEEKTEGTVQEQPKTEKIPVAGEQPSEEVKSEEPKQEISEPEEMMAQEEPETAAEPVEKEETAEIKEPESPTAAAGELPESILMLKEKSGEELKHLIDSAIEQAMNEYGMARDEVIMMIKDELFSQIESSKEGLYMALESKDLHAIDKISHALKGASLALKVDFLGNAFKEIDDTSRIMKEKENSDEEFEMLKVYTDITYKAFEAVKDYLN